MISKIESDYTRACLQQVREMARLGEDIVARTVMDSSTWLRVNPKTSGRVLTGSMLGSVGSSESFGKGKTEAKFGFLDEKGRPGYTRYQEFGTQYVTKMDAIGRAVGVIASKYGMS